MGKNKNSIPADGFQSKVWTARGLVLAGFIVLLLILGAVLKQEAMYNQGLYQKALYPDITSLSFRLALDDNRTLAPEIKLLTNNTIEGYSNNNLVFWSFNNSALCFYNQYKRQSARFDTITRERGRWKLSAGQLQLIEKEGPVVISALTGLQNNVVLKTILILLLFSAVVLLLLPDSLYRRYFLQLGVHKDLAAKDNENHLLLYGLPALVTTIALIPFLNFIPLWDGYIYYNALNSAVTGPFNLANFLFAGHPSAAYGFILSVGQYLDHGNVVLLNITNYLLALTAVLSFVRIINHFCQDENKNLVSAIGGSLFALNPLFLAAAVNLNLDFPVVVFFIASLAALLDKRYALSAFLAACMVFSKESGVLLYFAYFVPFSLLLVLTQKKGDLNNNNYRMAWLAIPFILLIGYMVYRSFGLQKSVFWGNTGVDAGSLSFLFDVNPGSKVLQTRIIQVFILNFHWVMTALAIVFFGVSKLQQNKKPESQGKPSSGFDRAFVTSLAIAFTVFVYVNALYPTFTNPRYILPAVPLLILFFTLMTAKAVRKKAMQAVVLSIVLILCGIQAFITIDPLSKALFGTFSLGNHQMLRMVSITRENFGYAGRDQLVYNTEFAVIDSLFNEVYRAEPPDPQKPYLTSSYGDFFLFTPVSIDKSQRTLRNFNIKLPQSIAVGNLDYIATNERPKTAVYINLPWMSRIEDERPLVEKYYTLSAPKAVTVRGYSLYLYEALRKD